MKIIWGRRISAVAAAFVLAACLAGCGLSNRSDVTTLAADENGKLTHTIIESVGENDTAKELTSFIEEQIGETEETVSSSAESGGIRLNSCKVSDGTATIEMEYDSWKDYEDFNKTTCFLGTIEEAENLGYDVYGQQFCDENGNRAENQDEITQRATEWKVLIFEEPMNVRVPDKILYTTDNMEVTGRLTASWKESASDDASQEESGESVSSVSVSSGSAVSSSGSGSSGEADDIASFAPEEYEMTYVIFK